MALFFLLVGLEIKREVLAGELREFGRLALPAMAAVGGIVAPASIYLVLNWNNPEILNGWAIPAATDIAFALGVLALFGSRVPLALKVFLTTVAIIDDLAAILIVAVFFTAKLSATALFVAAVCVLILFALQRFGVRDYGGYLVVGLVLWTAVLKSGVHATLAGVVVALFIPLDLKTDAHSCPARRLEHALHPWIAFGVLPLFAFANAGVALGGVTAEQALGGVSFGVLLGLAFGKPLGVLLMAGLARLLGVGELPEGSNLGSFLGVAFLSGIGFTMSLFIGSLAFDEAGLHYEVATRVGVFGGSILAALIGATLLYIYLPKGEPEPAEA